MSTSETPETSHPSLTVSKAGVETLRLVRGQVLMTVIGGSTPLRLNWVNGQETTPPQTIHPEMATQLRAGLVDSRAYRLLHQARSPERLPHLAREPEGRLWLPPF